MSASEPAAVTAARARADAARQRFLSSAHELQGRLKPAALADHAKAAVIDKGEVLAGNASDFARQRPAVVGGAAAAGVLFFARKPIARLFRRKPKRLPTEAKFAPSSSHEGEVA